MSDKTCHMLDLFNQLMTQPQFNLAIRQLSSQARQRQGQQRLFQLVATHEGLTNAEIAELLDIRPSSVSLLVQKLENKGFVVRVPRRADRRMTSIALTDQGKVFAQKVQETQDAISEQFFGDFSEEELDRFAASLSKLIDNAAQAEFPSADAWRRNMAQWLKGGRLAASTGWTGTEDRRLKSLGFYFNTKLKRN